MKKTMLVNLEVEIAYERDGHDYIWDFCEMGEEYLLKKYVPSQLLEQVEAQLEEGDCEEEES